MGRPRKYSEELRRRAVDEVLERGRKVNEVARDLAIGSPELLAFTLFGLSMVATLSGRGVCRLPDGAARVAGSLLSNWADVVAAHADGGCSHA